MSCVDAAERASHDRTEQLRAELVRDPSPRWARALIRSSHPGPCLAITAMTTLLAIAADAVRLAGAAVVAVFAAAVLAGQLSIRLVQ